MALRHIQAERFDQPMTEGGSWPALVKADDGYLYVAKLRGSAQGLPTLVAEVIVGQIAEQLHLPMPELVLLDIPEGFGKGVSAQFMEQLLRRSQGVNVGLKFVSQSVMFDSTSAQIVEPEIASAIVWLDSYAMNPDRTEQNPNLLQRGSDAFLIDHGAALYPHFDWETFLSKATSPFELVKNHVLLRRIGDLQGASERARRLLNRDALVDIVDSIPDTLLERPDIELAAATQRATYLQFLTERLAHSFIFEEEIRRAYEDTV